MKASLLPILLLLATTASADPDTAIMDNPYGAQLRLTQLDLALDANIESGFQIIATIKAENPDEDTKELQDRVFNLKSLREELNSGNNGKTPQELAQKYVDIKSEAASETKEFKQQARKQLSPSQVAGLKNALNQMKKKKYSERETEVENKRTDYNAYQTTLVLNEMGVKDKLLVEQARVGTVGVDSIKKNLEIHYQELDSEDKTAAAEAIKSRYRDQKSYEENIRKSAVEKTVEKNPVVENTGEKEKQTQELDEKFKKYIENLQRRKQIEGTEEEDQEEKDTGKDSTDLEGFQDINQLLKDQGGEQTEKAPEDMNPQEQQEMIDKLKRQLEEIKQGKGSINLSDPTNPLMGLDGLSQGPGELDGSSLGQATTTSENPNYTVPFDPNETKRKADEINKLLAQLMQNLKNRDRTTTTVEIPPEVKEQTNQIADALKELMENLKKGRK